MKKKVLCIKGNWNKYHQWLPFDTTEFNLMKKKVLSAKVILKLSKRMSALWHIRVDGGISEGAAT